MVLKICTNLKNFFLLEITNKHWWKSYLLGGGGGGGGAPLDGGGGGGVALGGGPLARFPLGFPEAFVLPEAEGEKEYCQVKSKSYNSFLNNWTKQMQMITGVRLIQRSNLMISFTDPEVKITSRSRGTLKYFSDLGPHGLKSLFVLKDNFFGDFLFRPKVQTKQSTSDSPIRWTLKEEPALKQ